MKKELKMECQTDDMLEMEELISDILAEWNPLGVDPAMSKNEYQGYIPLIVESIRNRSSLRNTIENVLKLMGIDSSLECVKSDIDTVCESLSALG